MSKYIKLWIYVKEINEDKIRISFKKIKEILKFEIDHSFLRFKKELKEYGYEVEHISIKNEYIDFIKIKI